MDKDRKTAYTETLRKMVMHKTISDTECGSTLVEFEDFRALLWELFPNVRNKCELWELNGALLLKWAGSNKAKHPVLFMNHHDVVPARSEGWAHPPFSGDVANGKIWGRGTLDDKGGLFAMFQAADELIAEGFVPSRDIWFETNCNEETTRTGAKTIAAWLNAQGVYFDMVFDEGGDIVREPISGANGTFAMIGVGEKSVVNLKFTARSNGGHASTPGRNTPIVRLGKFMSYVDSHRVFDQELSPVIIKMFKTFAPYMGKAGKVIGRVDKLKRPLEAVLPKLGGQIGALVSTTIAFTMTGGGEAVNVIPSKAWVVADMRCSHHQGKSASIKAITKVAKKFDIETEVISDEPETRLTDSDGEAFRLVCEAVEHSVPGVDACTPYIMTGCSDSKYFEIISKQCIRFLPFTIDAEQLDSIHGINEYLDVNTLVPAVDYYRYMMKHV